MVHEKNFFSIFLYALCQDYHLKSFKYPYMTYMVHKKLVSQNT